MASSDVAAHYGSDGLPQQLLSTLEGAFGEAFDTVALRGVDQFHLGGHRATAALLDGLAITSEAEVLDVGCGIGGVARDIASRFSCTVRAIDLTPAFVEVARALTDRVGIGRIGFDVGDALEMPYGGERFDAVVVVHVGMNIEDKPSLADELRRVAKAGAPIVIYDIVRLTEDPLDYPVPWATNGAMDFIADAETYADAFSRAGLALERTADRSDLVLEVIERTAADPPPVSLAHLMGERWPMMFANLAAAVRAGTLAPVEMTFRA